MNALVYDVAHSRSGDKGNTSNVAVIAYDEASWTIIRRELTADRVMAAYRGMALGPVERYLVPKLQALNFVITNALAGGVTRSLRLDPQGKSSSSMILSIELPLDDGEVVSRRRSEAASNHDTRIAGRLMAEGSAGSCS